MTTTTSTPAPPPEDTTGPPAPRESESSEPDIRWFADLTRDDTPTVGGKGANRLAAARAWLQRSSGRGEASA